MIYKKYLVREGDSFEAEYFPQIVDDLDLIINSLAETSFTQSSEMLITYCKFNIIDRECANANPGFANKLTSNILPVDNLKQMFASCSSNTFFRSQLEDFIRTNLTPAI